MASMLAKVVFFVALVGLVVGLPAVLEEPGQGDAASKGVKAEGDLDTANTFGLGFYSGWGGYPYYGGGFGYRSPYYGGYSGYGYGYRPYGGYYW